MPRQIVPPYSYTYPSGTLAVSGQPISSAAYNAAVTDYTNTFNAAWPITLGGTGTTDGSVAAPNGAAGGPSISFLNDLTTGFYRVAAGQIGISIAGSLVGTITASGLSIPLSSTSTIVSTGSSVGYVAFQGVSTEAAAAAGPIIDLYRNSASPAANDVLGEVDFNGRNSTPAKLTYAKIDTRIDDATAGTEDATMRFSSYSGGALQSYLVLGANAAGTAVGSSVGLPLGQLSFPAAPNLSANANTLDAYAEGTFTPAYSASGCTFSYASQVGNYTRIGNRVFFSIRIQLNNSGNTLTANPVTITGLPFTSANSVTELYRCGWFGATSSYIDVSATLASGASSLGLVGITAAATGNSPALNANAVLSTASSSTINIVGHYAT